DDPAARSPGARRGGRRRAAPALSGGRPGDRGGGRRHPHRADHACPQGGRNRPGADMRVFWAIAGVEARKRMSYRADFWINAVVGFAAELGVAWFIVLAMFSGGGRMGDYTRQGMLLYYVAVILAARVVRSADMEWAIADEIYQGALSRYLLYP